MVENVFESLAALYMRDVIRGIVIALDRDDNSAFTASDPTDENVHTVYVVAFNVLVSLEDPSTYVLNGQSFARHLAFSDGVREPHSIFLGKDRTLLHGRLDDDMIRVVMAEVAS